MVHHGAHLFLSSLMVHACVTNGTIAFHKSNPCLSLLCGTPESLYLVTSLCHGRQSCTYRASFIQSLFCGR